jgi:membrane associated rhomboid family serine protease
VFVPIGTEEREPRRRFPFVTATLVALNSLVFLVEAYILFTGGEGALNDFIMSFGVVPAVIVTGRRLHTLFTSMFVHGGVTHIAFNMLYLLAFGDNIEDRLGSRRYVIFYMLAGLLAAFAQIAVDPGSQVPSVGASGAIAGILAGYILLFPQGVVRMFLFLGPWTRIRRVPAVMYVAFWFITQFFNGVLSLGVATAETGGVAYWAHIGGFGAGLVLTWFHKQFRGKEAKVQT